MTHPCKIPPQTRVVTTSRPFRLTGTDPAKGVLLFHGFTGVTSDMRYVAERLNRQGLTVVVPRLPGHGTNGRDFSRTGWRDWLGAAVEAYLELASEFPQVMIGGLSMGGLIATIIAGNFPVSRVALLAPAFFTVNKLVPFTPLARFFVPPFRVRTPEVYDDPEQQFLADQYWNWMWPANTASLYRLIRMARRALKDITAPTLSVIAKKDGTVPLRVVDFLRHYAGSEGNRIVLLEESGHVVTTGVEKEYVAESLVRWFSGSPDAEQLK